MHYYFRAINRFLPLSSLWNCDHKFCPNLWFCYSQRGIFYHI